LSYGSGFVTMETNSATQIRLVTNGTTALTLATNQAATFSSSVEMAGLAVTGVSNKDIQFQSTTNRGWITPYDDGLWLQGSSAI